MFNDFNLSDEEILKIIEDYTPLIIKNSQINFKLDEDLVQEIKINIWKKHFIFMGSAQIQMILLQ